MKLKVQKDNPFLCPPGYQSAICTGLWPLEQRTADGQQMVRLGFDVFPNAADLSRTYKAGKSYPGSLTYGSPLLQDLEGWLGNEALTREQEFDTEQLAGMPALLLIKHRYNEGWDQPYVFIAHIAPAVETVQAKVVAPLASSGIKTAN